MQTLYNIAILFFIALLKIIALLGHKKIKTGIVGRKNWKNFNLFSSNEELYWIHAASLGELEQIKPLISLLKKRDKNLILVTLFSPSGIKSAENFADIDYVMYIPFDSKKNAKYFVDNLNIKAAIFVKYEFWFNLLNELHQKEKPTFFVNVNLRYNQYFFKPGFGWQLNILKSITHLFTVNEDVAKLLSQKGFFNFSVSGDTRFDKVLENSKQVRVNDKIDTFCNNDITLILGSSWPEEEQILSEIVDKINLDKIIIAPHDVSKQHIEALQKLFPSAILYSQYTHQKSRIIIIDCIGELSNLYQYSNFAFIGGGFKNALHNTLEATTFGNLVYFGNHTPKFPEAKQLIHAGCAIEITNSKNLLESINSLSADQEKLGQIKENALKYIRNNTGATAIICSQIK